MAIQINRTFLSATLRRHWGLTQLPFIANIRRRYSASKLKDALYALLRIRITAAGYSALLCLIMVFALNPSRVLFPFWCVLSYIFCLGFSLSILFRPRLKVSCSLPSRATAGREIDLRIKVENRSMMPAYEIIPGIIPLTSHFRVTGYDMLSCIKPGETAEIHLKLLPLRRGIYQLYMPSCYSVFPFGMFRIGRIDRSRSTVIVVPDYFPLRHFDIPMIRSYQGSRNILGSNGGDSLEYIGNREFRYGDVLKKIDVKAWARLGKPVVREYGREYCSNVGVVLDTTIESTKNMNKLFHARLEAAISLTASIIEHLCHDEHLITLFSAGRHFWDFQAMRNITLLDKVLEVLAVVGGREQDTVEDIPAMLVEHIHRLSVVVFVFTRLDVKRIEMMDAIAAMGCHVKAVVVYDDAVANQLPAQGGARITYIPAGQITDGKLERL